MDILFLSLTCSCLDCRINAKAKFNIKLGKGNTPFQIVSRDWLHYWVWVGIDCGPVPWNDGVYVIALWQQECFTCDCTLVSPRLVTSFCCLFPYVFRPTLSVLTRGFHNSFTVLWFINTKLVAPNCVGSLSWHLNLFWLCFEDQVSCLSQG